MKSLSGVAGAGPIFHRSMARLHRDHGPKWLERPTGLVEVAVDARTGKQVAEGMTILVQADRLPMPASTADRDTEGRILLDASYSEWLESPHNRRRADFALAKNQPSEMPLRILAPREGSKYLLDPELPNGGLLHLATNLPGQVEWSSSTLALRPGKPEPVARLSPGKHVLVATDTRNGAKQEVEILVEER
jgi:membrane carboxypeptidase/penicillin-binding protein PbpC